MEPDRQIQANRANAKRSTGPVTRKGKRASSIFATPSATGFSPPASFSLKPRSTPRFTALLDSLIAEFHPATPSEQALVETMAVARWKLVRNWGLHTSLLEKEIAKDESQADSSVSTADAFRRLADYSQSLHLLQRYDTSLDRQYARALASLLKGREAKSARPEKLASFGKNEKDPREQLLLLTPEETRTNVLV